MKKTFVSKHNIILDSPEDDKKVILNPLSGAIDIVNGEVIQSINQIRNSNNIKTNELDDEFLKICLEKGYLYHDQNEETERLRQVAKRWYNIMKKQTEHFAVYITFACNLKCRYCFQKDTSQDKSTAMSREVVESLFRAINYIHEERGAKENPHLSLFGGEPLLRRERQVKAVDEILCKCSENDYNVHVVTNGVELSYYCNILSKYNVESIQVSLDGPKEVHDKRRIFQNGKGTFDRIVKGIDEILSKNIPVVIRVNIDGRNIRNLPEFSQFISEKEWLDKGVKVKLSTVAQGAKECTNEPSSRLYKQVFDMYKTYPETRMMSLNTRLPQIFENVIQYGKLPFPFAQFCWATSGTSYSMDLNGDIFPCCCINACCDMIGSSYGRFHPELDLNKDILNLWHGRNVFDLPQCKDCGTALLCGGGCTRTALQYGRSLKNGVTCPMTITNKEIQVVFNHYYPQLKERAGI